MNVVIHGANAKQISVLNEWLASRLAAPHPQFTEIDLGSLSRAGEDACKMWAATFSNPPMYLREKLRDPDTWAMAEFDTPPVTIVIDDFGEHSVTMARSHDGIHEAHLLASKTLIAYGSREVRLRDDGKRVRHPSFILG